MLNSKSQVLLVFCVTMLGTFSSCSIVTAQETVDFGDSGILVVVEQEPESEGFETGYAYVHYDEFFDFFSFWDWFPDMPHFPIWDDGGDDDDCQDACDEAWDNALEIQAEWDAVQAELDDALSGGSINVGKRSHKPFSPGWKDGVEKLRKQLQQLGHVRDAAYDATDIACGCG